MDANLDNIFFPPVLYHQLYSEGIIRLNYSSSPKEPGIIFSGKNQNHVLIAVDIPEEMSEKDKDLLKNLMHACGLEMEDVALVNIRQQEIPFERILDELEIEKTILFGVSPAFTEAVFQGPEDKSLIAGNRSFIRTAAISGLHHQAGKKKMLWSALKLMFNL